MTNYICATCGVQHTETAAPPKHCPICEDERQYIGQKGQRWTSIFGMAVVLAGVWLTVK